MAGVILFVDDEEAILKILASLFRGSGFTPRCATSGKDALALLEEEHIHVCFVDLRMPEMDGMELCRRIKGRDPAACVYAVSAFVDHFTAEQFQEAGFAGTFHKPFDIELLLATARDALAGHEMDGHPQAAA